MEMRRLPIFLAIPSFPLRSHVPFHVIFIVLPVFFIPRLVFFPTALNGKDLNCGNI